MNFARTLIPVLLLAAVDADAAAVSAMVTDAAGAPVPEAVVYALPASGKPPATPPRAAVMDQVNKEFVPFVIPVQMGSSVTFPNKDNIRHHVYSFSPAKTFDLKLYSGKPANPVVFDTPGPVALGCNIHDWMVGFVYVVESPWFAKTARTGGARLDLPDGEYDLKVWHPWQRAEPPAQRVKVSNADAQANFKVDLNPPPKVAPH
jgi:plastocyanin